MAGLGGPVATFSDSDHIVFDGIILSVTVGSLFLALRGRKEFDSEEFFLGGRTMTRWPVAMSLAVSFMSGITFISTPAEIYRFGSSFWLIACSFSFVCFISAEVFLPVFYQLQVTTSFQYLEMRFSQLLRRVGAMVYIVQTVLYTGIVMYAPALALNQITGLNLWGALVATGSMCILYCTLGGLKAVIWSDVLQLGIMLVGFFMIIAQGVLSTGLPQIWEDARAGGRLYAFDFDPDPLRRHTFWTIIVGGTMMWVSIFGINQCQVQRYVSCPTLWDAKMAVYLNMVFLWVITSMASLCGIVAYSFYKNCDPITNGDVTSHDELLPYFVMNTMANVSGAPGFIVASAYCATLSTVSSSINSLVAAAVVDFIYPVFKNLKPIQMIWINMGLSVFFGLVCLGMAGVASTMGGHLQSALQVFGVLNGPLLGLFTLGMIFRMSNSKGGFVGIFVGLATTIWLWIGGANYPPSKAKTKPLPVTIVGCNMTTRNVNLSAPGAALSVQAPDSDTIYSLSYLYLTLVGMLTTILVGLSVSYATGGVDQKKLDKQLLASKKDFIGFELWNRLEASGLLEPAP